MSSIATSGCADWKPPDQECVSYMINVTKSFLPELRDYVAYLEKVWESGWLTNQGPMVLELENRLKELLGVRHLFFVNNGTIALQIAIKALDLSGEIITTPFSYVATTSSIAWEGCSPVFADISPDTLCIDPVSIEGKITPHTRAIMGVHVYGNPCDVDAIEQVAQRHNLKVIYDAAHAFGVNYHGRSILKWGDISTLSFHATKVFHTVEGGAIVTDSDLLAHKISYMRNFGHNGPEAFWGLGVNGKCSEMHAAMGLCLLPKVPHIIDRRKALTELYDSLLKDVEGLSRPPVRPGTEYNYAYYPVLLESEERLLDVRSALNANEIFPRRYFYPSLTTLPYVDSTPMPIAMDASLRVLCLPLFPDLQESQVCSICDIIRAQLQGAPELAGNV
jgi:dTDP-4-amino-4,6-dideoxygalactose transaminase